MPGIMGLRYNYKFGDRVGFFRGAQADASAGKGSMSPGTSATGGSRGGTGEGRQDAESQYGGAYNVDYKTQDNRSGREQVYGAETTPITEVDFLETITPKEVGGLFPSYTPPRNIQQAFNIISTPRTVADVRNPFTDLTKDVLNPDDDTQVDSLTEKDDEGIMATVKELLSNTLIGKGIGYLKEQYDKQKAKNLFANTMDPSPPPVDTIASLTAGLGGGEGQGLASIYTGPPALRPVSTIVEEEVVDPRTAEMEAFRAILRRNLGLI
jgi:hypothetical protein